MANYILYDESYLGPGFFIINKKDNKITQFLKLYIIGNNGFPNYGLRAFCLNNPDNPDKKYNIIDFTFTKDDQNGLYKIFRDLCLSLNDSKITTIDKYYQGENHFYLKEKNDTIILTIAKDIYGVKDATIFTDINIGDDMTCQNYPAIYTSYNQLSVW